MPFGSSLRHIVDGYYHTVFCRVNHSEHKNVPFIHDFFSHAPRNAVTAVHE